MTSKRMPRPKARREEPPKNLSVMNESMIKTVWVIIALSRPLKTPDKPIGSIV